MLFVSFVCFQEDIGEKAWASREGRGQVDKEKNVINDEAVDHNDDDNDDGDSDQGGDP